MNKQATKEINRLKRISQNEIDQYLQSSQQVLLLPSNVKIEIDENNFVATSGLENLDKKKKDLLTYIKINDALNLDYLETGVLMPRTYAESLNPIPEHISVQCLMFAKLNKDAAKFVNNLIGSNPYGKTEYDRFLISNKHQFVDDGDLLFVMNRRVGGWDGSLDRPVIELLCAGGHLATIFNSKTKKFEMSDFVENLHREISEELKISIDKDDIVVFGGFHNKKSNELVVLCGAFLNEQIQQVYDNTKNNIDENIDGIYVGYFDEIMEIYDKQPQNFAGGEKAKPTNFPSQHKLMQKIKKFIKIK